MTIAAPSDAERCGITDTRERIEQLTAEYGNRLGIRALGYPTSWAHTTEEVEALEREKWQ